MLSAQEKRVIISLISSVVIFAIYYIIIYGMYQDRTFDTMTEEFRFWASVILIFVPVMIVAKILFFILYHIGYAITHEGKEEADWKSDELDKLIDLKANKYFGNTFSIGFLVAMGSLILRMEPVVMFNIMLFAMVAGMIAVEASQLWFYRKGV